ESGEKFQIPDMLSNRADIYNLGEIIGDSADAFEMSYLENSLTSNPVLSRLASRSQKDVYGVIKLAQQTRRQQETGQPPSQEGIDFEGNYSAEELNEFVSVMVKLMRVRDVVLRVNREYITSAAQHDDYRTEPPFLLQGSYRNMNRIAEKVLPVMNDKELETLIVSSYQNDAQTLTSGTEANLLKFKELTGLMTPREQQRWEDIKKTFRQNVKLRGIGSDDKVGQVIATLSTFNDGLDSIRKAVGDAAVSLSARNEDNGQLEVLAAGLRSLSEQMSTSLTRMEQLASRPIEVPAIEMKWPDQLPSTTTPAADKSDRITVINRLPKSVYSVLTTQFSLMEQWLKPLTELTARQHQEITELRPMVEQCLKSYRGLLAKLEEAHAAEE
ncbi:MAG: AAA family ATPase, partial [Planctomycetaceae bacterium]|nr:AAA family ATPase [Planctomycetaceae bacterium]